MNVLVACEFSGIVRDAFVRKGHHAVSVDILPTESELGVYGHLPDNSGSWNHANFEIELFLRRYSEDFDLMIAHPPCTYLTVTGNKWMKPEYRDRFPDRLQQRQEAIQFFLYLINANIPKIAVENPISIMSTKYRKPDQIIQPNQFGHPFTKATCLWLKNLPKLEPTDIVEPEYVEFKSGKRMSVEHFRTSKLPADERWKARSVTFQGIANAMAEQWG